MWNPTQYLRFGAERKQPFLDLMALVERRPNMSVLDLGCGTGEWTRELHDHLGADETLGIDSSEEMLERAKAFANERVRFERAEVESFDPGPRFDLVFSNAALHWVADHERLISRLAMMVALDGQLAVQMPANEEHASHVVAGEVAREFGADMRQSEVLKPERYAELLHRAHFREQHVRVQIYGHLLPSTADVVEWVKGSLLTDYERRIGEDRFPDFLQRYTQRLLEVLGDVRPYFYTYKRVLFRASLR
jgi:trans-aconitate 2-methyltransferase